MRKIVKYIAMVAATVVGLGSAGAASAGTIIINDSKGGLVSYDTTTKVSTVLSKSSGTTMYDIAMNAGGDLFGVNGGTLYKMTTAGVSTAIGSLNAFVNGLVFGADGTLYGSGDEDLYKINTSTGEASLIGATGQQSSGDLAFFKGQMYLASDAGLALVNPLTGASQLIGGTPAIFGLASTADTLFGVKDNAIYTIDPATGLATQVAAYTNGLAYGAASLPMSAPTSVPEPATWAMMLLGLVLVGYALRRRQAQAVPHAAIA
ncbi:PEPxxWA-CTERM sorting domain-containing protein [Sphingomonas fuzhouensis]|uniref:PEPxxWA-CTERM sorting domain-containing protein n=1 Tax=Sphingomonas fuzhouensis TaxID=3106033 RepID=UPI002AFF3505|nr:PEPxxWA-CTERM sorting domain-containing protein [Sphingomonas sp. SGZ-02]